MMLVRFFNTETCVALEFDIPCLIDGYKNSVPSKKHIFKFSDYPNNSLMENILNYLVNCNCSVRQCDLNSIKELAKLNRLEKLL